METNRTQIEAMVEAEVEKTIKNNIKQYVHKKEGILTK